MCRGRESNKYAVDRVGREVYGRGRSGCGRFESGTGVVVEKRKGGYMAEEKERPWSIRDEASVGVTVGNYENGRSWDEA